MSEPGEMSPVKTDYIEEIIPKLLRTKTEKTGAVVAIYDTLLEEGVDPKEALRLISHEHRHAQADSQPGAFGYYRDPKNENKIAGIFYRMPGGRSHELRQKISLAPDDPSNEDIRVAIDAYKQSTTMPKK